jgi:hypothetical protein
MQLLFSGPDRFRRRRKVSANQQAGLASQGRQTGIAGVAEGSVNAFPPRLKSFQNWQSLGVAAKLSRVRTWLWTE